MRLKSLTLITCGILFAIVLAGHAQTKLTIPQGINLLPDSTTSKLLINSLNGFLAQEDDIPRDNTYALKERLTETAALLDAMKGSSQNLALKDNDFYKPYLNNVTALADGTVLIRLSYMGITANQPVLHASYSLIAKQQAGQFYFYSPLQRQTAGWKVIKVGYITCHYKDSLKLADIKAYRQTIDYYDSKLKAPQSPIELYYCKDFPEVMQVLGIDYKAEYSGIKSNILTARENGISLNVNGWYDTPHRFDPHDLFHDRLRVVMNPDIINRPVDEGCAYLYGGSWGYTWPEIKSRFKKYLDANPNPDWLTLYLAVSNFEAGQKPLKVAYVLNALIAQKLEKEKGMPAVMELLGCGKREQGDANYFRALEKLTGITRADFNIKMTELVKQSL